MLHDHLGLHGNPLRQKLWILRGVAFAGRQQREVHQGGNTLGVAHPKAHLTLNRDALKIRRDQFQHESAVLAGYGHGHKGAAGCVVEERQSSTFAHDVPLAELHQVHRRLGLDEFDSKHEFLLITVVLYNRL